MAVSERTKSLKKKRSLFFCLSFGLWAFVGLFLTIFSFANLGGDHTIIEKIFGVFSEDAQKWLLGLGTTFIICLVATVIIKDKMMTFGWMVSLILAVMNFGQAGMWVLLSLWLADEYVLLPLFKHYCHLVQINKEIDLR